MAATLFVLSGCANLQSNAGKSLATVADTVDATMKGWAAWVATGKTTVAQETQVKALYANYQVSMAVALNAYLVFTSTKDASAYNVAFTALVSNKDALVRVIQLLKLGN